jgi:hypothetical protein
MPTHTRNKPRTSTDKHVHRNLNLVTPLLQGKDVEQLQIALNALCDHYEFDWMHIKVDGEYGRRSARRAAFCMELIGVIQEQCDKARHTGHVSELNQRMLRNPEKRGADERRREENRKPKFRKLRHQHNEGLNAAVAAMLKHKGVNEQPAESNHGPYPIDKCQDWFGLSGVPWCGCCVGYFIESPAGADLGKTGTWWPHAAFIKGDALAGRNGLEDINPANVRLGDIITFFNGGDDHVTFARGNSHDGVIPTVEGNTSSATQDSDGGIIETKERSFSEVTCAARLNLALV